MLIFAKRRQDATTDLSNVAIKDCQATSIGISPCQITTAGVMAAIGELQPSPNTYIRCNSFAPSAKPLQRVGSKHLWSANSFIWWYILLSIKRAVLPSVFTMDRSQEGQKSG
jgi:hypothetical protein